MPKHRVKASNFIKPPGPTQSDLDTGRRHVIEVGQKKAKFVEFHEHLFLSGSAVLLPEADSLPGSQNSNQFQASALILLAAALKHLRSNSNEKILVAGHSASNSSDKGIWLSEERAKWVATLLGGNRSGFVDVAMNAYLDSGSKDKNSILNWAAGCLGWNCGLQQNNGDIVQATRQFQRCYNSATSANENAGNVLLISGVFDKGTWGAVYDCVQHELAKSIKLSKKELLKLQRTISYVSDDRPATHCSNNKPIDELRVQGFLSSSSRRVEILIFSPDNEPDLPCHRGDCRPKACESFDPDFYSYRPILISKKKTRPLSIRLLDYDLEPYKKKNYRLEIDNNPLKGITDDKGYLKREIPVAATTGQLTLTIGSVPDVNLKWQLEFKELPQASTVEGAVIRLRNLGYYSGPLEQATGKKWKQIIKYFQSDWAELKDTGLLDDDTVKKILELHEED